MRSGLAWGGLYRQDVPDKICHREADEQEEVVVLQGFVGQFHDVVRRLDGMAAPLLRPGRPDVGARAWGPRGWAGQNRRGRFSGRVWPGRTARGRAPVCSAAVAAARLRVPARQLESRQRVFSSRADSFLDDGRMCAERASVPTGHTHDPRRRS